MGTQFINRIIPLKTLKNYTAGYKNVEESTNLLQACYENPLFEEDGTLGNETHTKLHTQADGIKSKHYDVNNGAQTSVHYRQARPRRRWLYCLALAFAVVAIIAIVVAVIVGQRRGKHICLSSYK